MSKNMCPSCKTKVDKGAQYCSNCGTTLVATAKKRVKTDLILYWTIGIVVALLALALQNPNWIKQVAPTSSVNTGDVYTALTIKARYRDNALSALEALKSGDFYLVMRCGEIKPATRESGAVIRSAKGYGSYGGRDIFVSGPDIAVYCSDRLLDQVRTLQTGDVVKLLVSFLDYQDRNGDTSFLFEAKEIEPSTAEKLDSINQSFGLTD
jgi:predicted nucleic acid-binding Zn ribbon protein